MLDVESIAILDRLSVQKNMSKSQLARLIIKAYIGGTKATPKEENAPIPLMGSAVNLVRCESPRFCKITKTKKYEIPIKDEDGNEKEVVKFLCDSHKQGREII